MRERENTLSIAAAVDDRRTVLSRHLDVADARMRGESSIHIERQIGAWNCGLV